MDEDRPEDATLSPDSGRAKRAPPTIDLEASEISSETKGTGTATGTDAPPRPSRPWRHGRGRDRGGLVSGVAE
jgi:hypothetical protein